MLLRRLVPLPQSALKCKNHCSSNHRLSRLQPGILSIRPSSIRWQSTESEQEVKAVEGEKTIPPNTKNENFVDNKDTEQSLNQEDLIVKELKALKLENKEIKDKYLRVVAEFQNLQARSKRELQAAKNFAIQKFAKDLVESVDNLDRALGMVPPEKLNSSDSNDESKDLISLYEGLKMTESVLMSTLTKHGLERFDPSVKGEKFNPNEHEATFMTPLEGKENNTVFSTQQKGYKLNGRILRAAKVGVVKNSEMS